MKTHFYLADDIQHMPDGKLLAVGLYGDATVVVPPDAGPADKPRALARLCILVTLTDMPLGKHTAQSSITYPDGSAAPEIGAVVLQGVAHASANLLCRFAPFPMPEFGAYKFTVTMGKESATHEFTIRDSEGPAKAPRKARAAPPAKKAVAKRARTAATRSP